MPIVDDKKRHRHTEAQEWWFRLINDPKLERHTNKWLYLDLVYKLTGISVNKNEPH
jgi:hypothetical protein